MQQAAMEPRPLGETSLLVSRLGLGLAALGRPGYINLGHAGDLGGQYSVLAMEARAHRVIEAAWQAGVRYFDAARSYGRAERFLASWLLGRGLGPRDVTVGSKWGYAYTANWEVSARVHEVKEHSLPVLLRQEEETREMLGEHLGLYQVHSATLESGVLEDAGVVAELSRLRDRGVRVGVTLTGPRQGETLMRVMEVEADGRRLFDAVQATWNLLEPSAGSALRQARAEGMGVIVKEALANGRLTDRNADPAAAEALAVLTDEARRLGTTPDALGLAAVLAQPWADVVLSGAATPEQLASNLRSLDVPWDEDAEERLGGLSVSAEEYWRERSRLPWN